MIQRNSPYADANRTADFDLSLGLNTARGLDLYSEAEPALDDIVTSGDAIEAMLDDSVRVEKVDARTK